MKALKPFLFDTSFDPADHQVVEEVEATEEAEELPPPPTFSEEDMRRAHEEGFEEGRHVGQTETAQDTEARIANTVAAIRESLPDMFRIQAEANTKLSRDAVAVAMTVARKLLPGLNKKNGLQEIEDLVRQTLEHMRDEPRFVIRIAPDLQEAVEQRLAVVGEAIGYEGRLVVMPDETMDVGDCRIEWTDGGAERNIDETWKEIEAIVERNLAEHHDKTIDDHQADAEHLAEGSQQQPKGESPE